MTELTERDRGEYLGESPESAPEVGLHEWEQIDHSRGRLAVPGGWVYELCLLTEDGLDTREISSVFVPDPAAQSPAPALTEAERAEVDDIRKTLDRCHGRSVGEIVMTDDQCGTILAIIDRLLSGGAR